MAKALVGVIMGSKSDWGPMTHSVSTLESLGIPCEVHVMSAHRTPDEAADYAATAEERGVQVLIAAAGGAAHLAGVLASKPTILRPAFWSSADRKDRAQEIDEWKSWLASRKPD